MSQRLRAAAVLVLALAAGACAARGTPSIEPLRLPKALVGQAAVLTPDADGYARADVASAVRPAGQGNVSAAVVVRLTRDIPVFRLWNGPAALDAAGRTNRLGAWWTAEPPTGAQADYRRRYEVCQAWNALTWVATCTLKAGAIIAVGPGNSVSAAACGDPTGRETYPGNARDWQLYVARAWERVGPGKELACPEPSADYEAEPAQLSRPKRVR